VRKPTRNRPLPGSEKVVGRENGDAPGLIRVLVEDRLEGRALLVARHSLDEGRVAYRRLLRQLVAGYPAQAGQLAL